MANKSEELAIVAGYYLLRKHCGGERIVEILEDIGVHLEIVNQIVV